MYRGGFGGPVSVFLFVTHFVIAVSVNWYEKSKIKHQLTEKKSINCSNRFFGAVLLSCLYIHFQFQLS